MQGPQDKPPPAIKRPSSQADNDIYTSAAALLKFLVDDEWTALVVLG